MSLSLSPDSTVSEIANTLPGAAEVFRRHGISFCCGGKASLAEAAANSGFPLADLTASLQALVDGAAHDAPQETGALIDHILTRYHDTHRAELEWLIPLAQKVEMVHGDREEAPHGLAEALIALAEDLDSHMVKEERVLFPMMKQGGNPMIVHPIAVMRHEHDDTAALLRRIEHVSHGLTLPEGACGSWTALYTGVAKLTEDVVRHMHLENDILFPRFEAA